MRRDEPLPQAASESKILTPNPSLLRKLAVPVIGIAIQAIVATASLQTLSILRVFIQCESQWSKSQKNAFNFLAQYLDLGDEQDYQRFQVAVADVIEHNAARQALEKPVPDTAAATDGFQRVGVHPNDVPGVIFIFLHFGQYSYFRQAIDLWRQTDAMLAELVSLGKTIHAQNAQGGRPGSDAALRTYLREFDARFSTMATGFSKFLGAGTRDVTTQLAFANIGLALALMSLVVWRMRNLFQRSQLFESALSNEKEQAQVTLQALGDAVIRVNAAGCIDYANAAAERLMGVNQTQALGHALSSIAAIVDNSSSETRCQIDSLLKGQDVQGGPTSELTLVTAARTTPVSVQTAPFEVAGKTAGTVLVLRDMTRERELIARLLWQASHDELTGLANRRELDSRLRAKIAETDSECGDDALLLLDLDQFKLVNDTCGHAAGDQLLREVATLLQLELDEGCVPVRLGGDEFSVILANCDIVRATETAERLRSAIQDLNFVWGDRLFKITASIGLVTNIGATPNAEDALRAADVACYMAKDKGRNRVQVHEPTDVEMLKRVSEMGWVHKIHDALDEDRLRLYAQRIAPLQSVKDETHFELLVRLIDENGAVVLPGSFIPAAERFGLMPLIDRWVVNAAFANLAEQLAACRASETNISFAINLSGQSLGDPAFVAFVRSMFQTHLVSPSSIIFEITETAAIANLQEATKFIRTFREIGCKFALDDFGAGMSSFGYLKRLSVDYLKIDGSFVKDMLVDPIDHAMVDTIARMARKLGKKTIAEFAETDEIIDSLRELGVDYAQGYGISRPAPLGDELGRASSSLVRADPRPREWNRDPPVQRCA